MFGCCGGGGQSGRDRAVSAEEDDGVWDGVLMRMIGLPNEGPRLAYGRA